MTTTEIIDQLRHRASKGVTASGLLRYLVEQHGVVQQIVWMELFRDAFETNLGNVTPLSGWWHEGDCELNDQDLDAYVQHVIDEYLQKEN